ncbi:lactonase family protein [Alloacidobacterium dinghuense]|uniref:Lactonase family protein n=2 Tax=Alloacidobacterium dinghuense TaxID=2763107 RepID=A0A7G8BQG2_9BACT|nr:lactonase family protein [Alloacidobacterium dinghuense]
MGNANRSGIWSRRNFIKAAAPVVLGHVSSKRGLAAVAENSRVIAYVGSYTSAVDGGANGEGIYRFDMDAHTGAFTQRKLVAKVPNPSWIVIHPSKKYLYTVNEIVHQESGSVSAFEIEPTTGDLTPLNVVSSEGSGPAHMSLDASGKYAFVANYAGGTIAVLPIVEGGRLGAAIDVHRDLGSVGAKSATNAPPGSFAISGHDAPHAHMIAPDPGNRFVLSVDLGQDRIYVYRFDSNSGKLSPSEAEPFVSFPSGNGPRHFVFHPNGRWIYVLGEESSTIAFFHYDSARGTLTLQQTISSLPERFAGTNFTSEVVISPDGRFLYAANRLHDTIAICAIDSSGRLTLIGEVSTMGDYPRHCTFDPRGDFFYVCNQRSDSITCFQVQRQTGSLSFTGLYTAVGSPSIVAFLS